VIDLCEGLMSRVASSFADAGKVTEIDQLYINTPLCPTDSVGCVFWLGSVEARWVHSFFSHVLCASPLSGLRNLKKSHVLSATAFLQYWQLPQIGLGKTKKSRTVCSAMLRQTAGCPTVSQQYRTLGSDSENSSATFVAYLLATNEA
jgi:hypothetical protein